MEVNDLTLKVDDQRYVNVRANLVLIHPQKGILFHTLPWFENNELTLFGGRVKFAETLEMACHRELEEELNLQLPLDKTWWCDHVFLNTFSERYQGTTFHEFSGFGLYYLPETYDVNKVMIDGEVHTCHWLPLDRLLDETVAFVPPKLGEMIAKQVI